MKIGFIAIAGAASLVASADAGFAGFVAYGRNVGANTVIDVFAAVTNASDKFLNVYDLTSNGTFVQKAGLASKTWKPDAANFTSTRAVSDDSFMTAGTYSGGAYGGNYYAVEPCFYYPNTDAWPGSTAPTAPPSRTIPQDASWSVCDPASGDSTAERLDGWAGSLARCNSVRVGPSTGAGLPPTSIGATHGIWVAHLVIAGSNRKIGVDFTWRGSASVRDGATGAISQGTYEFPNPPVPAPGALALLSIALRAGSRRRAPTKREVIQE
jgi:hypothetical protein